MGGQPLANLLLMRMEGHRVRGNRGLLLTSIATICRQQGVQDRTRFDVPAQRCVNAATRL